MAEMPEMTDSIADNGPLFSVIIPAYNGAKTLSRAIQSVLDQSFRDFELIVLDDGSTDRTAAVAQGFGQRVRYRHQPNGGVSRARNHAAQLARGRWLAFLDCDDWFLPDRLARHAAMIEHSPSVDFLISGFESRDEQGRLTRNSLEATLLGRELLAAAGGQQEVLIDQQQLGTFIRDQFSDVRGLSVPRRTFIELGGFPEQFSICEDVYFIIRLANQSRRAGVVLAPLAVYSIHPHGLVRSDRLRAQQQTVAALTHLRDRLPDPQPAIAAGLGELLYSARQNLATVLLRGGEKTRAVRAVLPMFGEQPVGRAVRTLLSVLKGLSAESKT